MSVKQLALVAETATPPIGPLTGGRQAKRDRVLSSMAEADRVLANGARVVGRVGLHGSENFQVVNVDPSVTATQTYPKWDDYRAALRLKWNLAPGCVVNVSAMAVPSGAVQKQVVSIWDEADEGPGGEIVAECRFINGANDETETRTIVPLVSLKEFYSLGSDPGEAWDRIRRYSTGSILPGDLMDATNLRKWADGTEVEVVIYYRGSPRVVDLVVQEVPYRYVQDADLDAPTIAPLTVGGGYGPPATYPLEYPVEERSAADPTFGTLALADAVHRQQRELGPILANWTAWDEATQDVDEVEAEPVTSSTASFTEVLETSLTAYNEDGPGHSLASGGNARQWNTAGPRLELRDDDAVIPVRIRVYASVSGGGSSTVRFTSKSYSIAEMTISGGSAAWHEATGHLRCGLGPEDPSVMQVLAKRSGGGVTLNLYHFIMEYVHV